MGLIDPPSVQADTEAKVIYTTLKTCEICGGHQFRVPQEYQKSLYKPSRLKIKKWEAMVKENNDMLKDAVCHICETSGGKGSNAVMSLAKHGQALAASMTKYQNKED